MTGNQRGCVTTLRGGVRFGPKERAVGKPDGAKPRRTFGTTIDTTTYEEFVRVSALHNLRVSEILDALVRTGAFSAAAEQISKS